MGSDQTDMPTEAAEQVDQAQLDATEHVQPTSPSSASLSASAVRAGSFDLLAFGILIFIAASFAFTARLNAQPPNSLVPAAVAGATGLGLHAPSAPQAPTTKNPGVVTIGPAGICLPRCC